jgi:hypothetical protein
LVSSRVQRIWSKTATYLGDRCGENNHFIEFTHSLHELVHAWPLDDVDVVIVTLNLNGYREIGLVQNLIARISAADPIKRRTGTNLERAVHEGLVQI